jgi:hypothetical protein
LIAALAEGYCYGKIYVGVRGEWNEEDEVSSNSSNGDITIAAVQAKSNSLEQYYNNPKRNWKYVGSCAIRLYNDVITREKANYSNLSSMELYDKNLSQTQSLNKNRQNSQTRLNKIPSPKPSNRKTKECLTKPITLISIKTLMEYGKT